MSLDDPEVVRAEYADERGLEGGAPFDRGWPAGQGEVSARGIARELGVGGGRRDRRVGADGRAGA